MREIKKWLTRLISRIMPTQTSSGDGAIQIGKMGGGVTNVHLTQHIYADPNQQVQQQRAAPQPRQRPPTTTEQSQVLALMDHLADRMAVLDFMEREFDTRMVIRLDSPQLYRLRRYVEVILAARNGQ